MKDFFKKIAKKAKPIIKKACHAFGEAVKAAAKEFVAVFFQKFFGDDTAYAV